MVIEMASFGSYRPTTSCQCAIARTTVSCNTSEIFDVEEYCDLEIHVIKFRSPCEFMYDLYIAEIYRSTAIFCH